MRRRCARSGTDWRAGHLPVAGCLLLFCLILATAGGLGAAEPLSSAAQLDAAPHYNVQAYAIQGIALPSTNGLATIFSKYTGTNVALEEIVRVAADVQLEYAYQGRRGVSVAIAQEQITNGIVTLHVFQGAFPQILVSGRRYARPDNSPEVAANPPPTAPGANNAATTNGAPSAGTNAPPAAQTNAAPHFNVRGYEVTGNTLLSFDVLLGIFSKHVGTNTTFEDIKSAASELQAEYASRKYPTVRVAVPQQTLGDGIVKIDVFEGRLEEIIVSGSKWKHYFSSNNVMASMPSLQTNMILNSALFQAELDRANANQDRQIYPKIEPGPEPGTSMLRLEVKDRLPLHAKAELNNQSSPGTPEMRVNTSATYNNLWQEEHSLGLQYSFSPLNFKTGNQWNFYDQPLVANYGGFYRMPLGSPSSIADEVETRAGTFGYDEASRKFNLPPSTGRPDVTFYASRSTIDTGIQNLSGRQTITNIPGVLDIEREDDQQDLTVNNALGFRLSEPLSEVAGIRSTLSGGVDFKQYDLKSLKTNNFFFSITTINDNGLPNPPIISTVASPVPATHKSVNYLPVSLRWDANRRDELGSFDFGLGYTHNFSPGVLSKRSDFANISGSTNSDGFYHILTASLARDQIIYKDRDKEWRLALRADGQWTDQPLISNEQFGVGGINGVRGYREGEVFGDTGWRITSELKTPQHLVGLVGGSKPLSVRASLFMDYAETYLLDPAGRNGRTALWGTGCGFAGSIGSAWEARLMFAAPLLNTPTSEAGQLRISFSLSGQF